MLELPIDHYFYCSGSLKLRVQNKKEAPAQSQQFKSIIDCFASRQKVGFVLCVPANCKGAATLLSFFAVNVTVYQSVNFNLRKLHVWFGFKDPANENILVTFSSWWRTNIK